MNRSDRLIRWALVEGPAAGLALFRIVTGLMVIRHLIGYARDYAREGFFGNTFFMPYGPIIPQPTEGFYLVVLTLGILSAAFLIAGYKTRTAAITCFLMVAYHLSLNQIWYRHNRYFLVLALFLLCLGPCGNALSIDALRSRIAPVVPLWTEFLIKVQMTLIYLASAMSKTMDAGWRSGDVLIGRRLSPLWEGTMPDFLLRLIPGDAGVRLMTVQALASEFFLAIFVWFPRTRRLAFWWGIVFHGFIEVQYSVISFTYLTLASYFLFADLRCGEKVWIYSERSAAQRFLARVIPWLDWFFQMRLTTHSGKGALFVARDGTTYRGWLAWIMLAVQLPIPFAIFYPLSWLRFFRWGRSSERIESTPVESPKISSIWLVTWLALYLAFVAAINLYGPWRFPADSLRLWDLPWFFVLMCLMAAAYHRGMVSAQRSSSVKVPAEQPAAAVNAVPSLS